MTSFMGFMDCSITALFGVFLETNKHQNLTRLSHEGVIGEKLGVCKNWCSNPGQKYGRYLEDVDVEFFLHVDLWLASFFVFFRIFHHQFLFFWQQFQMYNDSMKLVIASHSLYWSIHNFTPKMKANTEPRLLSSLV